MNRSTSLLDIVPLAAGVWAAVPKPGTGRSSNSGIVDTGRVTVVFDTLPTPQAAKDLRSAARLLTGRDPSHVVNSHWHWGHTLGNRAFGSAVIVSTERTQEILLQRGPPLGALIGSSEWGLQTTHLVDREAVMPDGPARDELREELAWRRAVSEERVLAQPLAPGEVYRDRFRFPGERAAVVTESGGHSESDSALWVPEGEVLFTGDLVTLRSHPDLRRGDLERLHQTLDRIEEIRPRYLVPGHGPVTDASSCAEMRRYIEVLAEVAQSGAPVEAPPPEFADWAHPSLFVASVQAMRAAALP